MRFLARAPAADGEAGLYQVMVARITEHPGARLALHQRGACGHGGPH
jgi:hypothetical protein